MTVTAVAMRQSRMGRGAALARLALRIGGRYAAGWPRLLFASVERRGELRHDLALRSADEVAEELGSMKGVLMKLGQMASYIYEDMPLTFRAAMSRLQHRAPPMTSAIVSQNWCHAGCLQEVGPGTLALSIGRVRAITRRAGGRRQSPVPGTRGASPTSAARRPFARIVGARSPRLTRRRWSTSWSEPREEVDYARGADWGDVRPLLRRHPFIGVWCLWSLSPRRATSSRLGPPSTSPSWDRAEGWPPNHPPTQPSTCAFNGDPHPAYLFHRRGRSPSSTSA
jgi:hypothetical protein